MRLILYTSYYENYFNSAYFEICQMSLARFSSGTHLEIQGGFVSPDVLKQEY